MTQEVVFGAADGNRLLDGVPSAEYERLEPHLEPVTLDLKQSLYRSNEPITHVYFVDDGVASLLQPLGGAEPVEVATVGKEGMVGIPVFLGAESTQGRCFAQISGHARRMTAERFNELVTPGTSLHEILHRYTQALMVLMAQNGACNRRHGIVQRYARWLAMTRDRMSGDTFPLTQEFLGQMLGVRRAGVSEAAGQLQAEGLIRYSRGQIEVLDRSGLETRSCDCYWIIRSEFERMINPILR